MHGSLPPPFLADERSGVSGGANQVGEPSDSTKAVVAFLYLGGEDLG